MTFSRSARPTAAAANGDHADLLVVVIAELGPDGGDLVGIAVKPVM